jgi:hypothetical protein
MSKGYALRSSKIEIEDDVGRTAGNIGMPGDADLAGYRQGGNLATPCRESAACVVGTLDPEHRASAPRPHTGLCLPPSAGSACALVLRSRARISTDRYDRLARQQPSDIKYVAQPGRLPPVVKSEDRETRRNERGPLTRERVHDERRHDGTGHIWNNLCRVLTARTSTLSSAQSWAAIDAV